jgi:polyphosphate glucokinase
MNVLSIDIGGTDIKFLATGETERRRFDSGPAMTPEKMVAGVRKLAADWKYDVVGDRLSRPRSKQPTNWRTA